MGPAGVSIPSSRTRNTSPPAGTGPQSVSSLMASIPTRWTCGARAACSMRWPGGARVAAAAGLGGLRQGPEAGPRGARPSSGFVPVPPSAVPSLQSWCHGGFLTRQERCQALVLAFWAWRKEHCQLLLSPWPAPALGQCASPFGLISDRTDEAK